MSIDRCMCGDTECPSCGSAQGTYVEPWVDAPESIRCEICEKLLKAEEFAAMICLECACEVKRSVRQEPLP